jgi:RNA polymerase sigma factor (sigma-70 family)
MTEVNDNEEDGEDLIEWKGFLEGDDRAFVYFYKKYIHALFNYGMCFTIDRELVKDCIQELFVKLYSHRSHLKETENVKLYLFKALKNTLFNAFQKDQPFESLEDVSLTCSTNYTIEDRLIDDEQEQLKKEKVIHVLELLTAHQKEAIYYRYMEEMSLEDIGIMMNMNYQSIQNLLQRAIRKMRSVCLDQSFIVKINDKRSQCS